MVRILSKMNASVEHLNVKIAVIIERTSSHEKRIDRHDKDIEQLKTRRPKQKGV